MRNRALCQQRCRIAMQNHGLPAGGKPQRGADLKDLSHSRRKTLSKAVDHFPCEELELFGRAEQKTGTQREEVLAPSTLRLLEFSFEVSINLWLICFSTCSFPSFPEMLLLAQTEQKTSWVRGPMIVASKLH